MHPFRQRYHMPLGHALLQHTPLGAEAVARAALVPEYNAGKAIVIEWEALDSMHTNTRIRSARVDTPALTLLQGLPLLCLTRTNSINYLEAVLRW